MRVRKQRIILTVIAVALIILAVLGWSMWRQHQTTAVGGGDTHTAKESTEEIQTLDTACKAWKTELWALLNRYADGTADLCGNPPWRRCGEKAANLCQDVQNLMPGEFVISLGVHSE